MTDLTGDTQFLDFLITILFNVYGCLACIYAFVPRVCLLPAEARRGLWLPGIGVRNGWEPPCSCWEVHTVLLEECSHLSIDPALLIDLYAVDGE